MKTTYTPSHAIEAKVLCEQGATDDDLAMHFDVEVTTIWRWRGRHPEFAAAVKVGKGEADDRVERSLYSRATGYTFKAVKVLANGTTVPYLEHVPPETLACIFWLKNRRPEVWREKSETHTYKHDAKSMTDDELVTRIRACDVAGSSAKKIDPPKSH